jgi:hypothetical protein
MRYNGSEPVSIMTKQKGPIDEEKDLEDLYESGATSRGTPFAMRFIAGTLVFILFLLSFQGIETLIRPEPDMNVSISDVRFFLPSDSGQPFGSHGPDAVAKVLEETQKPIKQIATFIASNACKSGDIVCQTKALFYFVRDQITYVPDPQFHDELANPLVVLRTGGADCEDMAVLVSAFQRAIGNDARLVFVPGHVYAQVRIPSYKDTWYNLEATCKTCKFNDIPTNTQLQEKDYIDL